MWHVSRLLSMPVYAREDEMLDSMFYCSVDEGLTWTLFRGRLCEWTEAWHGDCKDAGDGLWGGGKDPLRVVKGAGEESDDRGLGGKRHCAWGGGIACECEDGRVGRVLRVESCKKSSDDCASLFACGTHDEYRGSHYV